MILLKLCCQHCTPSRLVAALLSGLLFYFPTVSASQSALFPEVSPSPVYSPSEVVGIQMRALGQNHKPYQDAGIELTFRFASPNNKKITGPLERFALLFVNPAYEPMINFSGMEIGHEQIDENTALVPVLVEDNAGNKAGYVFSLSKQNQPPLTDCWMTDSVVRIALPDNDQT